MRTGMLRAVSSETEPAESGTTGTTDAATGASARGVDVDDVAMMLRELRACDELRRAAPAE